METASTFGKQVHSYENILMRVYMNQASRNQLRGSIPNIKFTTDKVDQVSIKEYTANSHSMNSRFLTCLVQAKPPSEVQVSNILMLIL